MKRLLALFLSLSMIVCLAACGGNSETGGEGEDPSGNEPFVPPPSNPNTPPDEGEPEVTDPFVVTLLANGKVYIPSISIYAQWKSTADGSVSSAKFDNRGRAVGPSKLDGEYDITLSAVPQGYAYNPNIYHASNQEKEVEIELFNCLSVSSPSGDPNPDTAMTLSTGRIYRVTLDSATDRVWFNLPTCRLETWCDTIANDVTPTVMGYTAAEGSGFYNADSEQVIRGGGTSGTYTQNVKFEKDGEYGALSFFSISAQSRTDSYPVTVEFQLTALPPGGGGGTTTPDYTHDPTLYQILDMPGRFRYNYQDTNRQLVGSRFKLFERGTTDAAGNEGDGYYHLYDGATNTYGAIIFAVLNKPCELLDRSVMSISVAASPIRYYNEYTNQDGAHPVTEELRVALNSLASREQYFYDGYGYMEMMKGLTSLMEDQWLFCCGYYVVV